MPDAELLTLDQAQILLHRLHTPFAGAHAEAWSKWQKLRSLCAEHDATELLLPLSGTTRANFVNNHCVALVEELVEPGDGVYVAQANGLFTAVLAYQNDLAAFVRFKALNRDLRPSNVKTTVQRSLSRQELPANLLTGCSISTTPTVLTCGYRLSADEAELGAVYICCHYKNELIWRYRIDDVAEFGQNVDNLPLPNTPTPKARIVSTILPEEDDEVLGGDEG